MDTRENEKHHNSIKFTSAEIVLAVKMLEMLQPTIDIMYHLMDNEHAEAFVLMMISTKACDLEALLTKEKRNTDFMFEINKEESLYVMLCQDTKVDGGYHYAERIIRNIVLDKGNTIYCTELEVKSTHYAPKVIILKLLETFIQSQHMNRSGEIVFRSLR